MRRLTKDERLMLRDFLTPTAEDAKSARSKLEVFKYHIGIGGYVHPLVNSEPFNSNPAQDVPFVEVFSRKRNEHLLWVYGNEDNSKSPTRMSYANESNYHNMLRTLGREKSEAFVAAKLREAADAIEHRSEYSKRGFSIADFEFEDSSHHLELSILMRGILGG